MSGDHCTALAVFYDSSMLTPSGELVMPVTELCGSDIDKRFPMIVSWHRLCHALCLNDLKTSLIQKVRRSLAEVRSCQSGRHSRDQKVYQVTQVWVLLSGWDCRHTRFPCVTSRRWPWFMSSPPLNRRPSSQFGRERETHGWTSRDNGSSWPERSSAGIRCVPARLRFHLLPVAHSFHVAFRTPVQRQDGVRNTIPSGNRLA